MGLGRGRGTREEETKSGRKRRGNERESESKESDAREDGFGAKKQKKNKKSGEKTYFSSKIFSGLRSQ